MSDNIVEVPKDDVLLDEEGNVISTEHDDAQEDDEDTSVKADDTSTYELAVENETPDEAEARRERNRQRRLENKQRRKEYIESLRREIAARDELLAQQEARLAAIERRTYSADLAAVDAELKKTVDAYNYFKSQHADAVSAADGQRAADAQERMMQAAERMRQLQSIRLAAARPQAPQPQPLDPRVKVLAEEWIERNSWYDPMGGDMDSRVALSVDQALAAEGWNPMTPQYWEELDSRLKKYLPHRYNMNYNKNKGSLNKAPVSGSGHEGTVQTGSYKLSAERVQALKDAGLWDDPKQRAEAIRRFKEYDKQKGAR